MKKIIFIVGLCFLASSSIQAKKFFVEMEYSKNSIKIDDGSNKKSQTLKDENGKDLKFRSLIGALNYMSLKGWELEETKSITEGALGATDTKVYYIFSKEVDDSTLQDIVNNSFRE